MVDESLRISVIGAQTAAPESPAPYTVYRTVVTHGGECYERLLRFSEFYRFKKKLKLRKSTSAPVKFPSKTWSRKSSLEDDVIEARQVMLNEFVKGLSKADLAPQSQQQLMKLLKIGKFEDGSGRVSELSSYKASFVKSDRGELDAILEAEDDVDKSPTSRRKSSIALDRVATLTATSVVFPAVTSNATTVLTEDERSNFGSRGRIVSEDAVEEQDAITADARTRAAPRRSTSTIPPSSYSDMLLQRPQLKASQSLSGRRSKHVEFPNEPATESNDSEESDVDGIESPTQKYRDRISTQLSTINRLLSESEADTEADTESSRSILTQSSNALTA